MCVKRPTPNFHLRNAINKGSVRNNGVCISYTCYRQFVESSLNSLVKVLLINCNHLSDNAIEVLRQQQSKTTDRPFPINANSFRLAWDRLRSRAGLVGFRFHDLRHEALTRFFEMGLSIPEVALISGHKDVKMLI